MQRIPITPRPNWTQKIADQGFLFYDIDSYYNESAAYAFTAAEIDVIEKATSELQRMCLEVVDHVVNKKLYKEFHIQPAFADFIEWSWKNDNPSFYGRFDLAYNGTDIKMLEFNADTPTSLLEASVIQWYWLQEFDPMYDQFNSIHEKLVAHMQACKQWLYNGPLYFACIKDSVEDYMTVKYLEDCAFQADILTGFTYMEDIGVDDPGHFHTAAGQPLTNVFKLYPWEWLFNEEFSSYLPHNMDHTLWIEPPYKAILSNKMLLVYLHELFPDSPYILPAYFNKDGGMRHYVKKPVYSREGANVSIVWNGRTIEEQGGDYGSEGFVYQEYFELPDFKHNKPVLGSWIIGGMPAGMGIRESSGLITGNGSRFCPHYFI
ncbi:Glutathionylspermidine synthase [Cnuella takakiae]|uniref:Glutathionylspermidine synthase n=1 Tax=Cnuella takakiae TaxID=1302690 RepID=A0A1M5EQ05_9BACT|nr:glutathionylspermidine synthase family protein [Cnuella takakiae]OLY91256.1 glutathionylspermidine synthase [Cnuella takakiae]SHF81211.1 Glutathionylspermidine synthase [Cnuella takakiae]